MSQASLDAFLRALAAAPLTPAAGEACAYDTSTFRSMTGLERSRAEDALVQRAADGDGRALLTVGQLGTARALDAVRQQAATATDPWVRLSAVRALARLGEPEEARGLVAFAEDVDPAVRAIALEDLGTLPGDAAAQALFAALDDPEAHVRTTAFTAFVARVNAAALGQDPMRRPLPAAPLNVLGALLGAPSEPLWRQGAWEARNALAALSAGRRAESVGLAYRPTAPPGFVAGFAAAVGGEDEGAVDWDLVQELRGADRRFAEVTLALNLPRGAAGVRAARALGRLGARWAGLALEAARDAAPEDGALAEAVDAALAELRG